MDEICDGPRQSDWSTISISNKEMREAQCLASNMVVKTLIALSDIKM